MRLISGNLKSRFFLGSQRRKVVQRRHVLTLTFVIGSAVKTITMVRQKKFTWSRYVMHRWCLLFVVCAAATAAAVHNRLDADIRRINRFKHHKSELVFPPATSDTTSCNSPSICVAVASCAPARKHPSHFKICGWDALMPLVCCPPATTAIINVTVPLRSLDPVPVNECAKQSPVVQTALLLMINRTAMASDLHIGFGGVGGRPVPTKKTWPFMVGIYVKMKTKNSFLCGGSLIAKNTVLTAAHCFQSSQPGDVYVIRLSKLALNDAAGVSGVTEFETSRVVAHPDFRPPTFYNDIALVKIDGVSTFSDTLRPVCLAGAGETEGGDVTAYVVGWGATETGGGLSSALQEVELSLVNNTDCNKTYMGLAGSEITFSRGITSKLLCAGNVGKPTDACQGDSGGPLVKIDSDTTIRQIGVVAGGLNCGEPGIPGIYTRVSQYRKWIAKNLN